MKHQINVQNLHRLFEAVKDDSERLELIYGYLLWFSDYHQAIFKSEAWRRLYNARNTSTKDYQEKIRAFEERRTSCHNDVLGCVESLNRMAESFEIPAIYDGTISRDPPYRREVADAVLAYVESIILERR